MRKRNTVLVAGFVAIVALASAVSSSAITVNPSTHINHLTFNQPVKLPGVVLPAGTYEFELGPPGMHPDIVRVSRRTGKHYFLGFTRPVPRPLTLPKNRIVEFGEQVPGVPPPIAVWYPMRAASGQAFVYR